MTISTTEFKFPAPNFLADRPKALEAWRALITSCVVQSADAAAEPAECLKAYVAALGAEDEGAPALSAEVLHEMVLKGGILALEALWEPAA